jgi:anti-anti-sigma factor
METQRVTRQGDALILDFPKTLNSKHILDIHGAVKQCLEIQDFGALVADLSQLQAINSAGIGLLVSIRKKCLAKNKKLVLVNPASQVLKTLGVVQLDAFFTFAPSLEEALRG